jgi:PASTA domain/NPCBM/NEW2 domain
VGGEVPSRLKRATLIVGAVTVLAGAILLGWFLHEWIGNDEVVVSVDRPVQVYAPETVKAGSIPNVIGLTEDDARRVFSDAGVDLSQVSVHRLPYVGPEDLVVSQEPPSGNAVGDRRMVLDISEPASMPDLTGSSESEARTALSELGARIGTVDEYQPGAAEGEVLSTEPAGGEVITDKATLHLAAPLSGVFLTELEPVSANCRTGEGGLVAGEAASEAIVCEPEAGANPRSVTYALGGQVESLEAELGLDDEGNADLPVEFRVFADGVQVLSRRLEFGERLPVEVPLLGKYQLRLESSAAGVAPPGSLPIRAAFAEPRLTGSRAAIDELSEGLGG